MKSEFLIQTRFRHKISVPMPEDYTTEDIKEYWALKTELWITMKDGSNFSTSLEDVLEPISIQML